MNSFIVHGVGEAKNLMSLLGGWPACPLPKSTQPRPWVPRVRGPREQVFVRGVGARVFAPGIARPSTSLAPTPPSLLPPTGEPEWSCAPQPAGHGDAPSLVSAKGRDLIESPPPSATAACFRSNPISKFCALNCLFSASSRAGNPTATPQQPARGDVSTYCRCHRHRYTASPADTAPGGHRTPPRPPLTPARHSPPPQPQTRHRPHMAACEQRNSN